MLNDYLIALIISSVIMFITWVFYFRSKNPGVVDVSWGLCILASCLWYVSDEYFSVKTVLASGLAVIWCARLSGFLWYTRVRPKHVEKRYLDIAKDWKVKKDIGFLVNFLFQAFLGTLIAFPFLFFMQSSTLTVLDLIATSLVLIGIIGEATADYQLYQFKQSGSGKVCDSGLWRYSRHPNYFFEIVTWFGFSTFVILQPHGYWALLSPVLLILIMKFITGRITERVSLQSKGEEFANYQRRTSMIFPLPPKKIDNSEK